jgi:hypothetical protein
MKFPLTLGDHFVSVYEDSPPFKYASRSVEADAAGKLILPTGTYEEVLRIKTVHNYFDSTLQYFYKEKKITYRWYSPLTREFLLVVDSSYNSNTWSYGTRLDVMSGFTSLFPVSVEAANKKNSILLYPNPSDKSIYIGGSPDIIRVIVKDINGEVIMSFNEKPASIDFSAPGIYFVTILTDKEVTTHKVVITM